MYIPLGFHDCIDVVGCRWHRCRINSSRVVLGTSSGFPTTSRQMPKRRIWMWTGPKNEDAVKKRWIPKAGIPMPSTLSAEQIAPPLCNSRTSRGTWPYQSRKSLWSRPRPPSNSWPPDHDVWNSSTPDRTFRLRPGSRWIAMFRG